MICYIDSQSGSDDNPGTALQPWATFPIAGSPHPRPLGYSTDHQEFSVSGGLYKAATFVQFHLSHSEDEDSHGEQAQRRP